MRKKYKPINFEACVSWLVVSSFGNSNDRVVAGVSFGDSSGIKMLIVAMVMVLFRNSCDRVTAVTIIKHNRSYCNSSDEFHFAASLHNNNSSYYHSQYIFVKET